MNNDLKVQTLGETENYVVWVSNDPETDEELYHIELSNITLHLFAEEWEEFTALILQAVR